MRQILFKAKRKDWINLPEEEWWVEGYYVYCRKRHYILPVLNKTIGYDEREDEWIEIDSGTLCQYTGLIDKNGKKIWENDIVRRTDLYVVSEPSVGFIEYDLENTSFLIHWTDKVEYSPTYHWKDRLEVIGNIFDNPDLLEVE